MNTPPQRIESSIAVGDAVLKGWLEVPAGAGGIVVFVHGSGSSRFSVRNNSVARYLRDGGLATLLFDLLTSDEDRIDSVTREYRFDIPLLSQRLSSAVEVEAPTLMVVGGVDYEVLKINTVAREQVRGTSEIAVVEQASHLFEEPGALEQVASLTRDWFVKYLTRRPDG